MSERVLTAPGKKRYETRDGLRPGSRTHVHLSADQETATAVGARHGRPVVLVVDSAAMSAGGHEFFQAANGVWLTLHVPSAFLGFPYGSPAPELAP